MPTGYYETFQRWKQGGRVGPRPTPENYRNWRPPTQMQRQLVPSAPTGPNRGLLEDIGGVVLGPIGRRVGGFIEDTFGGRRPQQPLTPNVPALPTDPRTPKPGVRGRIERILPGGRSGYFHDPVDADFQAVVEPVMAERISCPRGYVAVDTDGDGVNDACMEKTLAKKYGYWKPRPKPPISGWDAKAIRRADAARKRVKKLANKVGFTATEKGRGRTTRKKSC